MSVGAPEDHKAYAQMLRRAGWTLDYIARELGVSRSTVSQWLDPNHLQKQRHRRLRYGGTCVDCGARTDGSNGAALAPERCAPCRQRFDHENKTWTRAVVIDAIQRFAMIHGRPPKANEWILSDPTNGYPPRSAVYATRSNPKAPFASWNAAIQAAGFAPIPVGRYERTPETLAKQRIAQRRAGIARQRFDRGEARCLREEGLSYQRIAKRLGVSYAAVYRALTQGDP